MVKSAVIITVLLIIPLILARKVNALYRASYIDYLTGAYNRRYFEGYFRKVHKTDCYVSCIMIDIDDFKKVNDKYGHSTGDEVLKHTVELLIKSLELVQNKGFIVRYGGDEFFVVLKTSNLGEVKKVIGRIKEFEKQLEISYSIGYDIYTPLKWGDFKLFVDHVDMLMYKNKRENKIKKQLV